jgi:hypothetical protein
MAVPEQKSFKLTISSYLHLETRYINCLPLGAKLRHERLWVAYALTPESFNMIQDLFAIEILTYTL